MHRRGTSRSAQMPNELRSAGRNRSGVAGEDRRVVVRASTCVGQELRPLGRGRWSALNDSETIQATGNSAVQRGSATPGDDPPGLVSVRVHQPSPLAWARSTLKPLTKTNGDQHHGSGTAAPRPPSPRPISHLRDGLPVGQERRPSRCCWRPPVMMKMLSKIRNASSVRNSTATMIAAFMFGRVTLHSRCHARGAVDLGRLLQVLGHLGQPGEQQQRDERRGLPDLGQADHEQRRPACRRTS